MQVFYKFHNRHLHAVKTFNAVCLLTPFGIILGISAAMWVAHSCLNIVCFSTSHGKWCSGMCQALCIRNGYKWGPSVSIILNLLRWELIFSPMILWTVKEESMNTMCSVFALIGKRHMKVDFRLEETKWSRWNGHMQTVWGEQEQNIEGYIRDWMYGWCWSKLVYSGIYIHNKVRERERAGCRALCLGWLTDCVCVCVCACVCPSVCLCTYKKLAYGFAKICMFLHFHAVHL